MAEQPTIFGLESELFSNNQSLILFWTGVQVKDLHSFLYLHNSKVHDLAQKILLKNSLI